MVNYFQMVFEPIEKWLDSEIDSGNIWYYVVGLVVIIIFLLLKHLLKG